MFRLLSNVYYKLQNLDAYKFGLDTAIGHLRNNTVEYNNTDDLNDVIIPFIYFVGTTKNRPPVGSGYVLTISNQPYSSQLALSNSTNEIYYRACNQDTWLDWLKII